MAELIAICGNRCDTCAAHWSNVETFGREQVADGWRRFHGLEVLPAEAGCLGCLPGDDGAAPYPGCPIRSCVRGRGLSSCRDCREASCDPALASQIIFERARQA